MDSEFVMVISTVDNEKEGNEIINKVVTNRLAACGHLSGPINSVYHWEGKVTSSREWECVFKTLKTKLPKLESFIKSNHSYDVPQFIIIPIIGGESSYLRWIKDNISS